MNFYSNPLKKEYPINSTRQQNEAPPTLFAGLAANKVVLEKKRQELNLQIEVSYGVQNVIARENIHDKDYVQFKGFSPGLVLNYIFQFGKDRLSNYYGSPVLISHNINFHTALRPLFFNSKEASGVMLEIGIAYRMRFHFIESYKLKADY